MPIAAAEALSTSHGDHVNVCRAWPMRSAAHIATSTVAAPNNSASSVRTLARDSHAAQRVRAALTGFWTTQLAGIFAAAERPTHTPSASVDATSASTGQLGVITSSGTAAAIAAMIRQVG